MVVCQPEDALDEKAPHLQVVHRGQVDQDGAQDLSHLGGGRARITRAAWPSGASSPQPTAHPSSRELVPPHEGPAPPPMNAFGLFRDFIRFSVWEAAPSESEPRRQSLMHLLSGLPSTHFFLILELYFLLLFTTRDLGGVLSGCSWALAHPLA